MSQPHNRSFPTGSVRRCYILQIPGRAQIRYHTAVLIVRCKRLRHRIFLCLAFLGYVCAYASQRRYRVAHTVRCDKTLILSISPRKCWHFVILEHKKTKNDIVSTFHLTQARYCKSSCIVITAVFASNLTFMEAACYWHAQLLCYCYRK